MKKYDRVIQMGFDIAVADIHPDHYDKLKDTIENIINTFALGNYTCVGSDWDGIEYSKEQLKEINDE